MPRKFFKQSISEQNNPEYVLLGFDRKDIPQKMKDVSVTASTLDAAIKRCAETGAVLLVKQMSVLFGGKVSYFTKSALKEYQKLDGSGVVFYAGWVSPMSLSHSPKLQKSIISRDNLSIVIGGAELETSTRVKTILAGQDAATKAGKKIGNPNIDKIDHTTSAQNDPRNIQNFAHLKTYLEDAFRGAAKFEDKDLDNHKWWLENRKKIIWNKIAKKMTADEACVKPRGGTVFTRTDVMRLARLMMLNNITKWEYKELPPSTDEARLG